MYHSKNTVSASYIFSYKVYTNETKEKKKHLILVFKASSCGEKLRF